MPHKFEIGEHRTILAFAKTPEQQEEAREAGATFVAGTDIIRLIRVLMLIFYYVVITIAPK